MHNFRAPRKIYLPVDLFHTRFIENAILGDIMTLVQPQLGDVSMVLHAPEPKEMISVRREGNRIHVRVNYSSMDVIQTCLRKANLLLVEGWKPEDESVSLIFGTAFHKALEVFYTGRIEERRLPKLEMMMALAFTGAKEPNDLLLRATGEFIRAAQPLAQLPDSDKHSIVNGLWILHCYFKAYLNDPYVAHEIDGAPAVEKKFSLIVFEDSTLTIELFGTIDVILQHTITGEILPADHKTVGFLSWGGSSYFDKERPSHQYTGYLLAARRVFGIDTNNFMVNIVEKKARPKTAAAKGVSFPRQITQRCEDDYREFIETLTYVVRQFLLAREENFWPMGPTASCSAYGSCQYRSVCSVPVSMRETLLRNKFTKGENV